jgi:uncharacterized protein (TIGR00730 family)
MNAYNKRLHPLASESEVLTQDVDEEVERSQLIAEINEAIVKLERDKATIGDLKVIARAVREMRYAFKVFTPYRRQRKVTVFGSARLKAETVAYQQAVAFGQEMKENNWFTLTGAGGGIMEAGNVGAGRDHSMGVNIMLPFEQRANYILDGDPKLVHFKYFFTRKLMFVKEVHAIAVFAGGFGTLDEFFETITLVQTGKRDLMPIVLVEEPGIPFWTDLKEYMQKYLGKRGLISPEDMSLFSITSDTTKAVDDILNFYSVYNSMRYVKQQLILRLHLEPTSLMLEYLNDHFAKLLESGKIERIEYHPQEKGDEHLKGLPRIALNFNRRDIGLLRQMIDTINEKMGNVNSPFVIQP